MGVLTVRDKLPKKALCTKLNQCGSFANAYDMLRSLHAKGCLTLCNLKVQLSHLRLKSVKS